MYVKWNVQLLPIVPETFGPTASNTVSTYITACIIRSPRWRQEMVQLVIGLPHAREQSSTKRLPWSANVGSLAMAMASL